MFEIETGIELDLAVSAAMDIFYDKRRVQDCPKYSTDLNAAFAAAEMVGLFESGRHLAYYKGEWSIVAWYRGATDMVHLSEESTPALAICAAILKLKKKS